MLYKKEVFLMIIKNDVCDQCLGLLLRNIRAEFYMPYSKFTRRPTYSLLLDFTEQLAKIFPPNHEDHSLESFKEYMRWQMKRMQKEVEIKELEDRTLILINSHISKYPKERRGLLFAIFETLQTDPCEIYKYHKCKLNEDY